ncbi:MAG: DUF2760 domain-containing protein [Acidobacteria bacterium]|nr:DUF2760 domain-containing protein [Acidobacteriota bacterium]
MSRISLAFRSFFGILSSGALPAGAASALGLAPKLKAAPRPAEPARQATAADGALQLLGILQGEARLIDFLMEDISAYSDDQVGAAVRNLHEQCRQALDRHLKLVPVIDGVEGTPARLDLAGPRAQAPGAVRFLGKVPPDGKAAGGTLRHKGWRAERVTLPPLSAKGEASLIAPAEIEIE